MSNLGPLLKSYMRKKKAEGGEVDGLRGSIDDLPNGGVIDIGGALPEAYGNPNIGVGALLRNIGSGMLSLPRRAIENSQYSLDTGSYDAAVPMEAAMMTFGTGAGARGGLRPVAPAKLDHAPEPAYTSSHAPEPAPIAAEAPGDVGGGLAGPLGGGEGLQQARLQAERRASGRQPLPGLPTKAQQIDAELFHPGPVGAVHDVAERYMAARDTPTYHKHPDKYHEIDKEHSAAIARAYDEMEHAPNDPAVKASYEALIAETLAQYRAIKESGLKITPVGSADYPYSSNPRAVARDVADNNHMAFFKTSEGFGSDGLPPDPHHPMMKSSGEKIGDHDMLNNDIFRVVHDYFGHIKNGYGFRATGEDNAWRAHASMYSDLARPAMTSETRGQNSWVNYGPHGEANRTASQLDTKYADQKVGLMPEWTMRDRGSPDPIIAYHGTPYSFDKFDMSKIGTGEGAQAYGQGLYFAGHSPVSEWYRHQLSARRDPLLQKYGLNAEDGSNLGNRLASRNGDTAPVIDSIKQEIMHLQSQGESKAVQSMIAKREAMVSYLDDAERNKGHMYQVAIDHPPEHFLDWDKPLSQQPETIRNAMVTKDAAALKQRLAQVEEQKSALAADRLSPSNMMRDEKGWHQLATESEALQNQLRSAVTEDLPGQLAYYRMAGQRLQSPEASARLRSAGIPGIRYLDQGSRSGGQGTHNYVTFDAPRLLKRYAEGGAAFGTTSPGEDAERPRTFVDNLISGLLNGTASIPRRAIENSQRSLDTGDYDPGPTLEAAMLPMGTGAVAGVPVKGAEAVLGSGATRMKKPAPPPPAPPKYYEGDPVINAGVDARPNKSIQTVADPHRMMFPGVYRNPKLIAEEAASRVGPEDPAMKQLFGVTRGDLREMAQGRVGNEAPNVALAGDRFRGSLAAQNIQTPKNTQRLVDVLDEAGKHEGLRTADAWYIMDPAFKRLEQLYGREEAIRRYSHGNTMTGMASPGSDVMTEIQRGTAAHWLEQQGRFKDFVKYGGLTGAARGSLQVPADLRYLQGHPYHRTAQSGPMEKYLATGSIQSEAPKVPLYVHASGVPETGFQTTSPVGDAHFSRGVGLSDTRKGPTDVQGSFSRAEHQTLQPWWQHEVAAPVGLESVPAQARLWTALGPQTGVESALGAPKLELLSSQIMKAARRMKITPEAARDAILSGKMGAGAIAAAAVGPSLFQDEGHAMGGRVGYEIGGDVDDTGALPGPVFDPAKLAAVKAKAAPVFDPAKLAAVKSRKADEPMGAADVISGAIQNAPGSAVQFAKDVAHPFMHPIETATNLKDLGLGLLEKSGAIGTVFPSAGGGHEKYADAMGAYLKDRYGGIEEAKRSFSKDPVGVLSDASMVLTGGGWGAARLPGALGRAGEVVGAVGRAVDPLMAPVNAAKVGTKAVGELLTHTGAPSLENAYKAGVEGGEAGEVFRGQMRGTSDMTEPVSMAKAGLEGYRASRAKAYREGMGDITSVDRRMDPLDRVLDFGKVDDAVKNTERLHKFGVMDINEPAAAVRANMLEKVERWKAADPATYHTIEGMDALKKSLSKVMMDQTPGSPARTAAGEIYNAVRKTIVEYDPTYAKVMKDYEMASTQIKELERAMSLGEKASADTALRKLQSIMRNNVNTNYGRRLELGKLLEENGATHLMSALSGQALNTWFPRGLGKLGAEAVALGMAGHFVSPMTLAAAPFMSPRLVGEAAHFAGRTAGRALGRTDRALGNVGLGNRAAANIAYRVGRAGNPFEAAPPQDDRNKLIARNPYAP